MARRIAIAAISLFAAVVLLLLLPVGTIVSQEIRDVFVQNWPDVQQIDGQVRVKGPIRHAVLTRIDDIIVSPIKREETTRFVEAGKLVADGYPYLVLSLAGQVKGEVVKAGSVGAILLPNEETIQLAFDEQGQLMFPLEVVAADVSARSPYFDSEQPRFVVGFPEYRVLLYNTTDKTVEVDLFAYLTN